MGGISGEGNARNLVENQTTSLVTRLGQCENALVLALGPRWVMVTWQGRASLWLTWLSTPPFPTSSTTGMLTRWDVFSQEEAVEALPLTGFLRFYSISFSSSSLSISKQHETRYPNLTAYCNRLKDRPSIKATWPPAWLENPQGLELVKDV